MGMPDLWVNTLKSKDEDWDVNKLWHELSTTRPGEKRIGYVESHDQALVGDKTLIFRMIDQEMYWHMEKKVKTLLWSVVCTAQDDSFDYGFPWK